MSLHMLAGSTVFPGEHWEDRSASEVGLDADRLKELSKHLGEGTEDPSQPKERRVGVIVRDGYLVYAWGDQSKRLDWYSSSKPAVSTMLMFAVHQGLLDSVEARIADLGWPLLPKDQGMTFAHLANQVSGYALAEPPGAAWSYNDLALQLYVLLLEKVFGHSLTAAGHDCLAPLGFEDGDLFDHRRRVVATARDFARLGSFWMHRGRWAGRRVLPQAFFDAYMRPLVPPNLPRSRTLSDFNDYLGIKSYGGGSNQGPVGPGVYGFNWWFNGTIPQNGQTLVQAGPADMVMALGARGCYMIMLPTQRLLVAAQGTWGQVDEVDPADRARFNRAIGILISAILPGS